MSSREQPVCRTSVLRVVALAAVAILVATGSAVVPQQQEIIMGGSVWYQQHCQNCHGATGKGDGEIGALLKAKPADLTQISRNNGGKFPFWQTYAVIDGRNRPSGHGSKEMPNWSEVFSDEGNGAETNDRVRGRILQLVFYLESIQEDESDSEP